ncbi:MAG TPA: hypothetical protein VFX01_09080, partial [Methylophilaceae bacterium]|nr:hypothetical protein [Methylophilaceae bacterium]
YAWLFTRQAASVQPTAKPAGNYRHAATVAIPLLLVVCWSVLSLNTLRTWRFARESAGIDAIIDAMAPDQRAAALVIDQSSVADGNTKIYAHYPAWYQAERHGLIDFNFAWFSPQIVRYQPDRLPGIGPQFDWHPERFDWVKNRGKDYHYFFVRSHGPLNVNLFQGARCSPEAVMSRGNWTLFERRDCS